jgi:hypothetical protein
MKKSEMVQLVGKKRRSFLNNLGISTIDLDDLVKQQQLIEND